MGATADVNLYKSGDATLHTDSSFTVGGKLGIDMGAAAPGHALSLDGAIGLTGSFIMGQNAHKAGGGWTKISTAGDNGQDVKIEQYSNTKEAWLTNFYLDGNSG